MTIVVPTIMTDAITGATGAATRDAIPAKRITSLTALEDYLDVTPSERRFFESGDTPEALRRLPFAVTPHFLSLAENDPADPIRRQFVPSDRELVTRDYELSDPLGEGAFMPTSRLIHRYRDRVLLLVTDSCALHCRHCFRRRFAGSGAGAVTDEELSRTLRYLNDHGEIRELLLSGGDPLTLSDSRISHLLAQLRSVRRDLVLRMATRVPVVLPDRISDGLVEIVRRHRPLWVIVQVNHPRELAPAARQALGRFVDAGLPVLTQTVLLRGVNDRVDVLEELFSTLVSLSIKPYYLFQGDLAPGTAHFRVALRLGLELVADLRTRLSGMAMPVYAVDLPGGGGKVPLTESYLTGVRDGWYWFESPEGGAYRYPDETRRT